MCGVRLGIYFLAHHGSSTPECVTPIRLQSCRLPVYTLSLDLMQFLSSCLQPEPLLSIRPTCPHALWRQNPVVYLMGDLAPSAGPSEHSRCDDSYCAPPPRVLWAPQPNPQDSKLSQHFPHLHPQRLHGPPFQKEITPFPEIKSPESA